MADDPGRLRAGGLRDPQVAAARRAVHVDLRPRPVARGGTRPPGSRLLPEPAAGRHAALRPAAAADGPGLPGVRPAWLRPGHLLKSRVREERARAAGRPARLLLPHADAICLGSRIPRGRTDRAADPAPGAARH